MLSVMVPAASLVGRDDELAHLHVRRREASAARGGIVLVSGEAGVGKSRLLLEFARRLERARVRVGSSQCLEFAKRPYALALDALTDLRGKPLQLSPAASRDVQFEGIVDAFADAARSRAVVIFVEDIHWADPASIDLLWTLAREAASARILIVASYRSEALREDHPLFGGIARIVRLPNASTIELAPLAEPDLRALIDDAVRRGGSDVPYETRLAVARMSEGNPLFAEELLKTAVGRHGRPAPAHALPTTIRAAVLERLRPLAAADQVVLAQAAVIGRRFSIELLETMVGASRESILEAIRRARDLGLVEEDGEGAFAFHHALTREAIYESFLAAQVREFHARIVVAIESHDEDRRSLQELAYHAWAAGDREKAAVYGERAGDAAKAVYAYDEAARLYGYALDYVDRDSARAGSLLHKIGLAQGLKGAKSSARDTLDEACKTYARCGDLEGECESTIEYSAALYNVKDPDSTRALRALRDKLGSDAPPLLRVRVDLALAQIMALESKGDATPLLDAVEPLLPPDDVRLAAVFHSTRAMVAAKECKLDAYRASTAAALDAARRSGIPNYEAVMLGNVCRAFLDLGRMDEADRYFERAEAYAREHKLVSTLAFVYAVRARGHYLSGDLAAARTDVLDSLSLRTDYEIARPFTASAGTAVGMLLDDPALLERCFDEAQIERGNPLQIAAPYAQRLWSVGKTHEASALLRRALSAPLDARTPFDLLLTAARLLDVEEATALRPAMAALAARDDDVVFKAALALFDAIVASRAGDTERARDRAAKAAAAFEGVGYPLFRADALELAGETETAATLYEAAGAIHRVRRLRVDAANATSTKPAQDAGELTPRERDVLRLAGDGLSNAEIARRLSVTLKTVEKHMGAVYAKLGVNSRSKLLAYLYATPTARR